MNDIIDKIKPLLEPGSCVPINLDTTISLVQAAAALLQERAVMLVDIKKLRDALKTCEEEYNEDLDYKGASGMEQTYDEDKVREALSQTEKYDEPQS